MRTFTSAIRTAAMSAAALMTAPAASGAQSAVPATIEACYVPASGTIYRINTAQSPAPGAPSACFTPAHVRVTWNQQGPAGPAGPAGPPGPTGPSGPAGPPATTGYTRVTGTGFMLFNSQTAHSLTCPAGTKVVTGGFSVVTPLTAAERASVILAGSAPVGDDVWAFVFTNRLAKSVNLNLHAICL